VCRAAVQDECGQWPVFNETTNQPSAKIAVSVLSKIISNLEIGFGWKRDVKPELYRFPNADVLLPRLNVWATMCTEILRDSTLSASQKRQNLISMYTTIFLPEQKHTDVAAPDSEPVPSGPQTREQPIANQPAQGSEPSLTEPPIANQPGQASEPNLTERPHTSPDSVKDIDKAITDKTLWEKKWFIRAQNGNTLIGPSYYHVIVASPCGAPVAQAKAKEYGQKYPNVYFELWKTVGNCYYALTAGIGLTQNQAYDLRDKLRSYGMTDAYIWHWPS
jgi:hypothetical protein